MFPDDELVALHRETHTPVVRRGLADTSLRIGSILKIAIDSGSEVHVIPKHKVELWNDELQNGESILLNGAGHERLKYYGRLRITLRIAKHEITSDFEVADVRRAIFSVGVMEEHGWRTTIDKNEKAIVRDQVHLPMTMEGRLYIVTATVLKVVRATGALNGVLVMPLDMEEHADDAVEDITGTQAPARLEDVQLPRETRLPQDPHPAEKRLHSLTHIPHRDWCDICVKARGRDEGHDHAEEATRITDKVDGLEVVQMDYTYMEDMKILSLYATGHHGGAATAVERKGPYPWIVMWITKRLSAMGVESCRLKRIPRNLWLHSRSKHTTSG